MSHFLGPAGEDGWSPFSRLGTPPSGDRSTCSKHCARCLEEEPLKVDPLCGEAFCSACWRKGERVVQAKVRRERVVFDSPPAASEKPASRLRFRKVRTVLHQDTREAAAAMAVERRPPGQQVLRGPAESLVADLLTGSQLQRSLRASELDAHAESRAVLRAAVNRVMKAARRSGAGQGSLSKVDLAIIKLGKKLL